MRTQIMQTESLCLLPTQMPRPVSSKTAYSPETVFVCMCVCVCVCDGIVRLQDNITTI